MSLVSPNLDDRTFDDLLEEAKQRIIQRCPQWTDFEAGNPGMMLLELFAYLTEVMLYRLNRVPEKAYVEFLRLMGIKVYPPCAASVELRFYLEQAQEQPFEIAKGTRVTIAQTGLEGEPPIFVTKNSVKIAPGEIEVKVIAQHGEIIQGELLGISDGSAGQSYEVNQAPIVAATYDNFELMVGVEVQSKIATEGTDAVQYGDKTFQIWREVENFTNIGNDPYVYMTDRLTGMIYFAPALRKPGEDGSLKNVPQTLAAIPPINHEVRVWYRNGGGVQGNVGPNTITVFKDQVAGLQVTNPEAATGGRDAETLENALVRGPQELHSLHRAVTAMDFELLAQRSGSVARSKAFTKAELWHHAAPGTVEILLVPYLPEENRGRGQVTEAKLEEQNTEEARNRIAESLDERRPLGTACHVNWVRYKTVRVKAQAVIYSGEDPDKVKERVIERLHGTINPLPTSFSATGWEFGQPLRISDLYDIILAEPAVNYVEKVELFDDRVPGGDLQSVVADAFQERTWYAATAHELFRSQDDGKGWESFKTFPEERVKVIQSHPTKPGVVALVTHVRGKGDESRIYISEDCGETWESRGQTAFRIDDIAWSLRDTVPLLLMATNVGLFELFIRKGATPVQILVDPQNQDLGFFTVALSIPIRGSIQVAVGARRELGIFLSKEGGKSNTFTEIGLKGEDIRVLRFQEEGVRTFLWAGAAVAGSEAGVGCFSVELTVGTEALSSRWETFRENWSGGSCLGIAFMGSRVLAATYRSGVLVLDINQSQRRWEKPDVSSGLPIGDTQHVFLPIHTLDAVLERDMFLAGGPKGVYRSKDGVHYEYASSNVFTDRITLPNTWLFCSGDHEIEVVEENEAR